MKVTVSGTPSGWTLALFLLIVPFATTFPAKGGSGWRAKSIQRLTSEEPESVSALTMRVRPDVSVDTLRYIARNAQTSRMVVQPTPPLNTTLRTMYGSSHPKLKTVFLEFNPSYPIDGAEEAIEIIVPALPIWRFHVPAEPSPGNTFRQLIYLHMGAAGKKTLRSVATLNEWVSHRVDDAATDALVLPYTTGYFAVHVNPSTELTEFVQTLKGTEGLKIQRVAHPTALEPVPHWAPAGTSVGIPSGSGTTLPEASWAFDTLGTEKLGTKDSSVTIAVVDTGIATVKRKPDVRFVYWGVPSPMSGDALIADDIRCTSDVLGCNLVYRNAFPKDDLLEPHWKDHGTHVAGLASGRALTRRIPELNERLCIMVLKVVAADSRADSGNVVEAVRIANIRGAEVINLSLSGPRSELLEEKIKESASRLFVVAAGNSVNGPGIDLDTVDEEDTSFGFPARMTHVLPNAISVAAHDHDGKLTEFSHFGKTRVCIAAPGEDIVSTVAEGKYDRLSGTSQAAPIVSFTAGLLIASGFRGRGAHLKQRILASVDVTQGLRDSVISRGKLNIAKTLWWRYDVITCKDKNRKPLRGEITLPTGLSIPGQPRKRWKDLAKVVLNYSNEHGRRHLVVAKRGTTLDYLECDLDLKNFTEVALQEPGRPSPTIIRTDEIADITLKS